MFPIGDEHNGRLLTPYVTYALIALNVVVFFFQLALPGGSQSRTLFEFWLRWGVVPAEVARGQDVYTLVTSQFLHGGWLHLIGNMLFLWVFGDNVEDAMGHAKFLVFYLLSGVAAGLAQVVLSPDSTIPLVGASGAIAGVLGAYIVLFPHGRIRTLVFLGFFVTVVLVPAWVQLGIWFVLQFLSGIGSLGPNAESGGVAFWAHVGGFVAGLLLVWLFRDRAAVERQRYARAMNTTPSWQRLR